MVIAAAVFVVLAAALHVLIFVMESIWWTHPATWRRFGLTSQADANTTRAMAYNQGFYNLFLGVGAALGLFLHFTGQADAGAALVLFCSGSMVLAAIVLLSTGRGYLRAAAIQGAPPLIGFGLFLVSSVG